MKRKSTNSLFTGAVYAAVVLVVFLLSGCGPKPVKVQLCPILSPEPFSYAPWEKILAAHVKDGQVDYSGIRNSDMETLNEFLDMIARKDPSTFAGAKDELAFWINVYNAFAVKAVLDGYSPGNIIRKISFLPFRDFFGGRDAAESEGHRERDPSQTFRRSSHQLRHCRGRQGLSQTCSRALTPERPSTPCLMKQPANSQATLREIASTEIMKRCISQKFFAGTPKSSPK